MSQFEQVQDFIRQVRFVERGLLDEVDGRPIRLWQHIHRLRLLGWNIETVRTKDRTVYRLISEPELQDG